jgi:Tfp pilus assembly protein PilE
MKNIIKGTKGFTLTEVMFVAVITVMVIGVIVSAWLFTYKTWTAEGKKTILRVDLMNALETIKTDIRLSSATYMAFYPASSTTGEYTAISMPIARTDANGFFTMDSDNKVTWNKTVIYHIRKEANGTKTLRRTVYSPRDNTLTHAQLVSQISGVITSGTGGSGSTTDTQFLRNLDNFKITTVPAVVDFYEDSVDPVRVGKVVFGWARLEPGEHTIKFQVVGKNDDSSGYAIGIDNLMISPCGSKREVEYYNSSFAPAGSITSNGSTITRVYDTAWSNYNYLEYAATGEDDYIEFTDDYDLWRDSISENSSRDNTLYWGNEKRVKLELPEDRATGSEDVTWYAHQQAGDTQQTGRDGNLPGNPLGRVAIRTRVANTQIDTEGDMVRVKFKSATNNPVKIDSAYVTRRRTKATMDSEGLANQTPGSLAISEYHRHQQIFFKDTYDMDHDGSTTDIVPYVYIKANSEVWSEWTAFPLTLKDAANNSVDYFVSYSIPRLDTAGLFPSGWTFNAASSDAKYWQGTVTNTYYVTAPNETNYVNKVSKAPGTPVWGGVYTTISTSNNVYVSTEIDTWKKTGSVESEIFDTGLDSPAYHQVKWSEAAPAGTEINVKVRSSSSQFMTGASDWGTISGSVSNPQSLSIGSGRYVQYRAEMSTVPYWHKDAYTRTYAQYVSDQIALGAKDSFPKSSGEYLTTGLYSTWMDDVAIDWPGDDRICVISGYVARNNSYGKAKVTIDDMDIVKVLGIDMKVKDTFQNKNITEEMSLEVEPKNTGK